MQVYAVLTIGKASYELHGVSTGWKSAQDIAKVVRHKQRDNYHSVVILPLKADSLYLWSIDDYIYHYRGDNG